MFQLPLRGVRIVEQGTFITGPCAGMMLADLGADVIKVESPEGDPYRSLPARQLLAALPGLQPQQARHRPATSSARPTATLFDQLIAERRRLHPEFPAGHGRAARRGRQAAARPQPAARLLLHQRIRRDGPYAERPSYDSVAQALSRIPERRRRPGAAALSRSRARGRDHRHLRRVRNSRRAARARDDGPGTPRRDLDVRGDGAFRRGAVRRLLRTRRGAEIERPSAPRPGLHPADRRMTGCSRSTCPRSRSSGRAC